MENIRIEYKGDNPMYITQSSEDLILPSFGFDTLEKAELAVAIAKAIKCKDELHNAIRYTFRLLNLEW